ncbi:hypothetical protein RCL1_001226 [Eukaryota sp. TZLM3-RCL]
MDSVQANRQLQQMIAFIKSGAHDKVTEILVKAEEESNAEKLRTIEEQKIRIRDNYEKRLKSVEQERLIRRSNYIAKCKLDILQAQDQLLNLKLYGQVRSKLESFVSDQEKYKVLLVKLIIQCVQVLSSDDCLVRCCSRDMELVLQVVPQVEQHFLPRKVSLTVDDKRFLTSDDGLEPLGGVVVSCSNNKIRCDNSLEARIKKALNCSMPDIRSCLFTGLPSLEEFGHETNIVTTN